MSNILRRKRVKAKKEYHCDYCKKRISVGEEHESITFADDGIQSWRTCDRCKAYVDEALQNDDYNWEDGIGQLDFWDYMYEEHKDIATQWWQA
ncbi:hypothetical protein M2146_000262 [Lachnospiraceae bacterium PF1-22]|uniref:hypothetical protein n=1 Tax=Ohessyouella blattaphilus TaxID=2949333 RepID=UPI003E28C479